MQEKLLKLFKNLQKTQTQVRLVNVYNSYPVINDASVESINADGSICLGTHKHQLLSLSQEKTTFILCSAYPGYCKAVVDRVDFKSKTVVVSKVEYINEEMKQRETVRVIPKGRIPVWISMADKKFRIKCELIDISQEGIGLYLPIEFYVKKLFIRGASLDFDFLLPVPGVKEPVEVKGNGMIRNALGVGNITHKRLGIKVYYDRECRFQVSRYIQTRVTEIIREMEMKTSAYERMR